MKLKDCAGCGLPVEVTYVDTDEGLVALGICPACDRRACAEPGCDWTDKSGTARHCQRCSHPMWLVSPK